MDAMALEGIEKSALVANKIELTEKIEVFNKSFKSGVKEIKGNFGQIEQSMGDAISKNIGRNEVGNAVKEYLQDGNLVKTVERLGDGCIKTTSFDSKGTAYLEEITNLAKGTTQLDVKPNIEIIKDNFTAKTDQFGRTVSSKISDLQIKETGRETLSDKLRDGSYKPNDERGHIIADNFGGPATKENIVPQDKIVNKSQFKEVENTVRRLKAEGHKVDYEVKTNYSGKDPRPSSFEPKITVDGKEYTDLSPDLKKIYNNGESSNIQKAMTNTAEKVGLHHEAGMEAGAIAASVTCAMSTVDNVTACIDGEITADQAAINIAKDTATAGAVAYGAGFVSSAVSSSMASSSNALISSLGNSCVPAAAVSFGIASYDSVMDYAQGEIGVDELAYDLGENAVGVAGSIGGAALAGAAVGSVVPGAGTVVGAAAGLVGGMVGYAVTTGAYKTVVAEVGEALDEHSEEIKQLTEKAESIAQDTVNKAAELGENAVSDVKAAINDFNIKNAFPFSV